jgi:DNA-binding transcriptional MerR regulator
MSCNLADCPYRFHLAAIRRREIAEMTDDLMTIREMCDAFDVTPRTLRFYEQKELLAPLRDGQKRLFTRRDRARLKLILRGKRFGFSLEEIRQLLDLYHAGDQQLTQLSRTYQIAESRLADMERQRAELDAAIAELRDQLGWGAEMIASLQTPRNAAE